MEEVSIQELAMMVMGLCGFATPLVFADPKPGDIRRLAADNRLAKETIGYEPKVSLQRGLNEYIDYTRNL